jgi:uncharacterized protein
MASEMLYRFIEDDRRFVIDTETCFCFECDDISWDVLELYPNTPVNRIKHLLKDRHDPDEVEEVVGELEWLRHTSAILPKPKSEDVSKKATRLNALESISVSLPHHGAENRARRRWGATKNEAESPAKAFGLDAIALLLARAADQPLRIVFIEEQAIHDPDLLAELCHHAQRSAKLADRILTVEVLVQNASCSGLPAELEGHRLSFSVVMSGDSDAQSGLRTIAALNNPSLAKWEKALRNAGDGITGSVTLRPAHAEFAAAVTTLRRVGFNWIRLDLPGSFAADPALDADAMAEALNEVARTYAESLAANKYYRLDPVAELFNHIYDGAPNLRADPTGAHTLYIDRDGGIYPHADFGHLETFKLGSLETGEIDEERREPFFHLGSQNVGACRTCWARGLCGGGAAAVHHTRTGSIHTPDETWCNAQRKWLAALVASFNVLSSKGVDFTRVYQSLTLTGKPSVFAALRSVFQQTVGMRPIEEADGEMLAHWEEWNDAAYFSFSETTVLMTTQYDREMDALHPQGQQQELMLIHPDGTPFGLFRVKPERVKGAADLAIYFRNDEDYGADRIRKGIQTLIKQAGGQQDLRRLTTSVTDAETGLQQFLEALGFKREGTLREALFLHDAYHDVHLYGITV